MNRVEVLISRQFFKKLRLLKQAAKQLLWRALGSLLWDSAIGLRCVLSFAHAPVKQEIFDILVPVPNGRR
jgi:hypothetical protein